MSVDRQQAHALVEALLTLDEALTACQDPRTEARDPRVYATLVGLCRGEQLQQMELLVGTTWSQLEPLVRALQDARRRAGLALWTGPIGITQED